MDNPKSTIAGYIGLLGTVLAAIGAAFPAEDLGADAPSTGIGAEWGQLDRQYCE